MFNLRKLFRAPSSAPLPAVPAGQRVYAVGDVHGCRAPFEALIAGIEADDAARPGADTTVILLGDLVDRGPDSAGVLALARDWQARRRVRILTGNHEEMFLESFENPDILREFLRHGGRETVLSFGIDPEAYSRADLTETRALMRRHIPQAVLDFIATFEDRIEIGDYLFVHAGVRPGVPLDQQRPSDLRWIRGLFLDHAASFGPVIVHGHTIFERAEVRHNRIGIDTGAYATGRLTALGLEGTQRWLIEAHDNDGTVTTAQRSIA